MSEKQTLEEGLSKVYNRACGSCTEKYEQYEEQIRKSPIASVLFATAAGYFLQFLPIGAIVGGMIRLILALFRPAIFVFGVLKLVEYAKAQAAAKQPTASSEEVRDAVIDSPVGPV